MIQKKRSKIILIYFGVLNITTAAKDQQTTIYYLHYHNKFYILVSMTEKVILPKM